MLKVGLIGFGGMGATHARCWTALGDQVQLTAIADTHMERATQFAEQIGASVYKNGYELLEQEELDVVDICVPTFLHADYCIKAMEHVKNIIVEKPICLKEEEAQALLEAQARTGAFVQVGHVVRFMDAYCFLKELVIKEKYGKVIAGAFSRISPRPNWMKGHDDIDKTGTMTIDMHIHDADYICYLMGREPDKISVQAVKDKNEIIQHICSAYQFGDAILTAEGSWDYPANFPFAQTFRVRLEKAAAVLDADGILTIYPEDAEKYVPQLGERKEMDLGINISDISPYLNEMKYLVDTILSGKKESIVSLEDAIAAFRLVWKELELANLEGERKDR